MPGLNTTRNLPPRVQATYDRNLLERALPSIIHNRFGQQRSLKLRSGMRINFRRFNALPPALQPLEQGRTPKGNMLTQTDIEVTLQQYGDLVYVSDIVDMTNEDPVLLEAGKILAEQAAETVDILTRDVLVSGTNVMRPNGHTARGALGDGDSPSANLLRQAQRALHRQNAKFLREIVKASTGVSTKPVWKAFPVITHSDVEMYLRSIKEDIDYTPVAHYSNSGASEEDEQGTAENLRFFTSTNAKRWLGAGDAGRSENTYREAGAGGADVYSMLIFGQDAYGTVSLGNRGIQKVVKPFGHGDDRLDQRSSAGWKVENATVILQDLWMMRLEFTLPDLLG